jgi:RNA polymerase sigma-70 factor (ECF subfamily)
MPAEGHGAAVKTSTIEEIYRARYPQFLRVAIALLGDRNLAHDAVQEAFARALTNRNRLRSERGLVTWLWRTLTNICLDRLRSASHLTSGNAEGGDGANEDPHEWTELRTAIATLPERQRLVVFLRHFADLGYDAIAEVLEIRRGTVAATLHAAHVHLRQSLQGVVEYE